MSDINRTLHSIERATAKASECPMYQLCGDRERQQRDLIGELDRQFVCLRQKTEKAEKRARLWREWAWIMFGLFGLTLFAWWCK